MTTLSIGINFLFLATVGFAIAVFFRASHSAKSLLVLIALAVIQSLIAATNFYQHTDALPPRILFLIGPPLIAIFCLFFTHRGVRFIDSMNFRTLTMLHIVRIPVELVLYYLFTRKFVPVEMTFEGYNIDIFSGISALFILRLSLNKPLHRKILLVWNIICLLLLLNVVTIAILSASTPIQQLAFEQPNKAITFFPFVLLPGIVVPLVLLAHLVAIRRLRR